MFSFASKMLNTLMGEGEGGGPGGPGQQTQQQLGGGPPRAPGGPPFQPQAGPRLHQMSYPRHPSPQPILRGRPEEPNLDLSHLSAEERALIQNVMAKAKDLDTTHVPVKQDNQFRAISSKNEENRQNTYNLSSGSYGSPQNMTYRQDSYSPSANIQKPLDNFHQGNMTFQSNLDQFSQQKENIPYSSDNILQKTSENQNTSSDMNQRYDNFQMKTEIKKLQDNFASSQRKEFSLQRQESYNSPKQSAPYFNSSVSLSQVRDVWMNHEKWAEWRSNRGRRRATPLGYQGSLRTCWENTESEGVSQPGNTQETDCEYTTPSPPVSNSPEIRLSPSSPPASPSSEDNRTSLLATTSKDEIKPPQLPMESFYDHSPGEVYTIPEEEDEMSSPTSDGVTSLRKRRLVGAQSMQKEGPVGLAPSLQSNQYRSNNNFNTLNQNALKTNTPFSQLGNEHQNTNVNNPASFSSPIRRNDYMPETRRTDDQNERRFQPHYIEKQSDRNSQTSSVLSQQMHTDSFASKHEMMEKHFQSSPSIQYNSQQLQAGQGTPTRGAQLRGPELQDTTLQQQQQSQLLQQQSQVHNQQIQQQTPGQLLQQQTPGQMLQQHTPGQMLQQQTPGQSQGQLMQQQPSQGPLMQQPYQQNPNHLMQQQTQQQIQQPGNFVQQQQPQQQQSYHPQQQSMLQQNLVSHQQHSQQPQQSPFPQQTTQSSQPNPSYSMQQPSTYSQSTGQNSQQLPSSLGQTQIQGQTDKQMSQAPQPPQNPLQPQQSNQAQMQPPQSSMQQQMEPQSNIQQQMQTQSNMQQQMHRQQQQELQYLQMKKLQYLQRQQLHARANSRTPLLPQNKQNFDNNFQMMKSEAGFYSHEDSWRGYSEYPDDIGLPQFYGKDIDFEQKTRQQERAYGYQNDMEMDNLNLQKQNAQQNNAQAKSSAGTISGMLADFSRALGLGNSSDEKSQEDQSPHTVESKESNLAQQKSLSQHQIQAQIRANEQFIHGQQSQSPVDYQSSQLSQMQSDTKQARNPSETKIQSSVPNTYQSAQFQLPGGQRQVDYGQFQQPSQSVQVYSQQAMLQQQAQQAQLKEEYLNSLDSEQKAMYIQQQLYQKLPENQPFFAQNLTPQQQQMYQQHMQLQHHAQHLKKIKRSLPHSALDQQRQGQLQRKENNLNMLNQGLGGGVTVQQMMGAQFLNQQPIHPIQLMNSQLVGGGDMKLSSGGRLVTGSSPILVASGLTSQQLNSGTPLTTPQSTPVGTPRGGRDGGDSSDTMSETDSQKSLRTRRKLPSIPSDQEAITLPNSKKRDGRVKAKSPHDKYSRSYSPLRFSEGGYRISSSNLMLQRPSSSETNLRKISNFPPETIPRPGSALGLLQGSSVVSSSGMHTDYNRDSELASCLPPDLRYLLHSYKSSDPYSKQQFLQAYKDHVSGDRRALNRLSSVDWETERLLSRNKEFLRNPKSRLEIQRKIAYSGIGRSRKMRTHRRQLSDPKIQLEMGSLKDSSDPSYNRGYYGVAHPSLRPPYKSYEYESIEDGKLSEWDSSHPYLASYAIAGGALRETAINSVLDKDHMSSDPMRYDMRRYSDSLDLRRREVGKHSHKPRSWQPSPYGSDEEEDQLSREQKKAKIKAEIARRRQQIEENARLHEELLRLARLRESAELGYAPLGNAPSLTGDYAMSSVLKSIDDLIGREAEYRTPEDRSMDRIASTFRTDDYTSGVYERLTDFSPITDFSTPHAMPLLPDMPTRSRKLLEDLGSSPITDSVLSLPQKAKALL